MDGISRLFRNNRYLTTPLAVWNVARDPGHYAQLVLLLIGTLALGTASLALMETRDRGAWTSARAATGGSARIALNPAELDAATVDWARLPGVSASAVLLHAQGDPGSASRQPVHVIGVNPDEAAAAFPDLREALAPLRAVEVPPTPGLILPDDASQFTVQVYSTAPARADDPPIAVQLTAYSRTALAASACR